MNKIYTTQDYLRIELLHEEDVPTVISAKIKYINPDDEAGEWLAEYDSVGKKVYYDLPAGEPLGVAGKWTVWSFITLEGGNVLPGTPAYFTVYEEGETTSCSTSNCY